jgi:hypothetical protein
MYLTKEERIEIILLIGNRSQREAAAEFNRLHPHRETITQKIRNAEHCFSALLRHVTQIIRGIIKRLLTENG